MMIVEICITVVALLASLGIALEAEKTKNFFGFIHVLFFIVFVNVLHLARLVQSNNQDYDRAYYLLTHIVVISYLGLFTLGLLWLKGTRLAPSGERIFRLVTSIGNGWLFAAFSGWVIIKAYLVLRYGASAFSYLSQLQGEYAVLHFYTWWETPVAFYARDFAVGACGIYLIKAILERGFWRKHWGVTIAFLVFTTLYVGTHSSTIGPRRLLLLFVFIGLVTIAWRDKITVLKFLFSKWRVVLITGIVLIGSTTYYQSIRTNFFQPAIADKLLSGNPLVFANGMAEALIPMPENERNDNSIKFFREGPLAIMYDVIQKRGDGNSGTGGEITINAFLMVVPRIIVGEKKQDINVDDILEAEMCIAPSGPYLRSDVATSLLAIFMADFGYFGVLIAPMVLFFAITVFSCFPQKVLFSSPLFVLYVFSVLLNLSANVEGGLVSVLYMCRSAVILLLIILPFSFLSLLKSHKSS